MWDIIFDKYFLFLMVFSRMTGMILFNPFLNRKSIPTAIKMGLAFFCSILMTASLDNDAVVFENTFLFVFSCAKELLIGFFMGCILQLSMAAVLLGGDYIDLQLGIGMSKVYDPQSNISVPVTGSLLQLFYTVIFFAVNGHLTLIKILFYSFDIVPPGPTLFDTQAWEYVVLLFGNTLILSLKLALPIIAIEIITEMGLGTLMKTTPQINVFVVGMQLKLLVGLLLIVLVLPGLFGFLDSMVDQMFQSVLQGLKQLPG